AEASDSPGSTRPPGIDQVAPYLRSWVRRKRWPRRTTTSAKYQVGIGPRGAWMRRSFAACAIPSPCTMSGGRSVLRRRELKPATVGDDGGRQRETETEIDERFLARGSPQPGARNPRHQ